MIRLSYITLGFILILQTACRKDKVPSPEINSDTSDTCDCVPMDMPSGYITGFNYINDSIHYEFPRFNPNNENEIIFTVKGSGADELIYKYNLLTHSKSLVYQGVIFGSPKWGKSNWIIFTRGYGGVYRVRPDGSNLSLLIPGGLQFSPTFNHSGDKILTNHGFSSSANYSAKIWNLNGNLVDSMSYKIGAMFTWENQDHISALVGDSLFIIDPVSKSIVRRFPYYYDFQDNVILHDFVWLNENEALVGKNGLYKMNVWSGQKTKVACGCSSMVYRNGDANESGTKVLFNKMEREMVSENTIKTRTSIVIFDVATNTFEEVEIQ